MKNCMAMTERPLQKKRLPGTRQQMNDTWFGTKEKRKKRKNLLYFPKVKINAALPVVFAFHR